MNKEQFELLRSEPQRAVFLPEMFADKGDRTLLWGFWCNRADHHLYLADGTFYLYIGAGWDVRLDERHQKEQRFSFQQISLDTPMLIPDKRLYPEACDFDFCQALIAAGANLPWTTFNEERQEHRAREAFYGPF